MHGEPVQRKQQPRAVARDPVRHKLPRQRLLVVEAAVDDGLQRLGDRQAHLGPLRVVVHRDVVGGHQQRPERVRRERLARPDGEQVDDRVADDVIV